MYRLPLDNNELWHTDAGLTAICVIVDVLLAWCWLQYVDNKITFIAIASYEIVNCVRNGGPIELLQWRCCLDSLVISTKPFNIISEIEYGHHYADDIFKGQKLSMNCLQINMLMCRNHNARAYAHTHTPRTHGHAHMCIYIYSYAFSEFDIYIRHLLWTWKSLIPKGLYFKETSDSMFGVYLPIFFNVYSPQIHFIQNHATYMC